MWGEISTPQTRVNAKNKTGTEKTPEKTKDNNPVSDVSDRYIVAFIQKDLTEVKERSKRTIKDDNLESLVSTIVKKKLEQNNRVERG